MCLAHFANVVSWRLKVQWECHTRCLNIRKQSYVTQKVFSNLIAIFTSASAHAHIYFMCIYIYNIQLYTYTYTHHLFHGFHHSFFFFRHFVWMLGIVESLVIHIYFFAIVLFTLTAALFFPVSVMIFSLIVSILALCIVHSFIKCYATESREREREIRKRVRETYTMRCFSLRLLSLLISDHIADLLFCGYDSILK